MKRREKGEGRREKREENDFYRLVPARRDPKGHLLEKRTTIKAKP